MQTTAMPYATESTTTIYEMLFCDNLQVYAKSMQHPLAYPWNILLADKSAPEELEAIAHDASLQSRVQLLAFDRLRKTGHTIGTKELLGVVIEVPLEGGLDTLAAYKDGTAHYINQSGKIVVWETTTAESQALIEQLLTRSQTVVDNIGPWDGERLAPPPAGSIRLSFLVSDGLYFGQGPFEVLEKDPMAGPVIQAASQLLVFLTQRPS
jgi:hypothetical protein